MISPTCDYLIPNKLGMSNSMFMNILKCFNSRIFLQIPNTVGVVHWKCIDDIILNQYRAYTWSMSTQRRRYQIRYLFQRLDKFPYFDSSCRITSKNNILIFCYITDSVLIRMEFKFLLNFNWSLINLNNKPLNKSFHTTNQNQITRRQLLILLKFIITAVDNCRLKW